MSSFYPCFASGRIFFHFQAELLYLFISSPSMDTWIVSMFSRLWMMLLWTWKYKYLFRSLFLILLGVYPELYLSFSSATCMFLFAIKYNTFLISVFQLPLLAKFQEFACYWCTLILQQQNPWGCLQEEMGLGFTCFAKSHNSRLPFREKFSIHYRPAMHLMLSTSLPTGWQVMFCEQFPLLSLSFKCRLHSVILLGSHNYCSDISVIF